MIREREDYIIPETLSEASELLRGNNALLISGGTTLRFKNLKNYDLLVDISRAAPNTIKIDDGGVILGSMARIADILDNDELKEINCGILHKTAANIGTSPVRNQVTVGGNVAMVYRWSDLPVTLLALDAKMMTVEGDKINEHSSSEFFSKNPAKVLRRGEIVKEILFPVYGEDHYFVFKTFNKTKGDFAAINMAVRYKGGRVFEDLRIGISAITALPKRLCELERELEGKEIEEGIIGTAIDKHVSNIKGNDIRYGSEYLATVLRVMLRRALLREEAQEEVAE